MREYLCFVIFHLKTQWRRPRLLFVLLQVAYKMLVKEGVIIYKIEHSQERGGPVTILDKLFSGMRRAENVLLGKR